MLTRNTLQTLIFAAAAALLTCHPTPTRADDGPERAAAKIKAKTAPARDWVKEALLSLKVRDKILLHINTSDALRVHISTEGQTVTLTGEVEKKTNIARAGSLARSVKGVGHVVNSLTYAPDDKGSAVSAAAATGEHAIKDAVLETKIKSKLLAQMGAHALKIEVEAKNGVVFLSGSTSDAAHRDEAMKITRGTDGATQVNDQMTLTPADDAGN